MDGVDGRPDRSQNRDKGQRHPYGLQQPGSWAIIQRSNLPELTREFPVQIYELLDPPPTRICYLISSAFPDHLNALAIRHFKEEAYAYSKENGLLPSGV